MLLFDEIHGQVFLYHAMLIHAIFFFLYSNYSSGVPAFRFQPVPPIPQYIIGHRALGGTDIGSCRRLLVTLLEGCEGWAVTAARAVLSAWRASNAELRLGTTFHRRRGLLKTGSTVEG